LLNICFVVVLLNKLNFLQHHTHQYYFFFAPTVGCFKNLYANLMCKFKLNFCAGVVACAETTHTHEQTNVYMCNFYCMTLRHTQKESKVYISCQTEIQKASNKKRLQKGCKNNHTLMMMCRPLYGQKKKEEKAKKKHQQKTTYTQFCCCS